MSTCGQDDRYWDGYTQCQVNWKKTVKGLKFKANQAGREKKAAQNALREVIAAWDEMVAQAVSLEIEHQNAINVTVSDVEVRLGQVFLRKKLFQNS